MMIFNLFLFKFHLCVCTHVLAKTHVLEVRRKLAGVSFLLPCASHEQTQVVRVGTKCFLPLNHPQKVTLGIFPFILHIYGLFAGTPRDPNVLC